MNNNNEIFPNFNSDKRYMSDPITLIQLTNLLIELEDIKNEATLIGGIPTDE